MTPLLALTAVLFGAFAVLVTPREEVELSSVDYIVRHDRAAGLPTRRPMLGRR